MGAEKLQDGEYTLPEHADIPLWLINAERRAARNELRAVLTRGGTDWDAANRLAHRVVPERSTYARIEREHRAARRGITEEETMSDPTEQDTTVDTAQGSTSDDVATYGVGGWWVVDHPVDRPDLDAAKAEVAPPDFQHPPYAEARQDDDADGL